MLDTIDAYEEWKQLESERVSLVGNEKYSILYYLFIFKLNCIRLKWTKLVMLTRTYGSL